MMLVPGTQLGPYAIVSQLGQGGMGVVYTAHDPRLDRHVAIQAAATRSHGDGARFAFSLEEDIWIRELERGTRTRVTFEGPNRATFLGAWTSDGARLALSANRSGNWELYTTPVDGTGSLEPLLEKEFAQHVTSTSPDGVVAFSENNPTTGIDLWTLVPGEAPTVFV